MRVEVAIFALADPRFSLGFFGRLSAHAPVLSQIGQGSGVFPNWPDLGPVADWPAWGRVTDLPGIRCLPRSTLPRVRSGLGVFRLGGVPLWARSALGALRIRRAPL